MRGWDVLSPWNPSEYKYSLLQINLGTNSISNLEVVSAINLLSHGRYSYAWTYSRMEKYNLKLYLGTTIQTIALQWNFDDNYPSSTTSNFDEGRTQKQVYEYSSL